MVRKRDASKWHIEDDLPRPLASHLKGMLNSFTLDEDRKMAEADVEDDHWVFLMLMTPNISTEKNYVNILFLLH